MEELKAELLAQIGRTRELAGAAFSHVDFHMGLHRMPRLYPLFLDVAVASGTGRIRTHRYRVGMEARWPRLRHAAHMLGRWDRLPKYAWNLLARARARARGLAMPDHRIEITQMGGERGKLTLESYLRMLTNLPKGFSEFIAHPAYLDDELSRWSTYLEPRERERKILLDPRLKEGLSALGLTLAGYRDIPRRDAG